MAKLPSRRTLALVGLYAVLIALWTYFATAVAPAIITTAHADNGATTAGRWVLRYWGERPIDVVLKDWRALAGAVALAGGLHLALILLIGRWSRGGSPSQTAVRGRLAKVETGLLIAVSLVFLLTTALKGGVQDYYFYAQIWEQAVKGNDPWFLVIGGMYGKYPLNAYGPLFLALAPLWHLNPLAPKLALAFAHWAFVAWLVKRLGPSRGMPGWAGLALLVWHANPYVWVEIAIFGHFDVLVGLLCIAAVEARRRSRDAESAGWLAAGALLKFLPGVLAPFLALEKGRVRLGYLVGTAALFVAGMTAACLAWGWSPLRPFAFAAGRESAHLSIFRFLRGPHSPIGRDTLFFSPDQWATPILLLALYKAWSWSRRVEFETAAACVLAIAVTVLLYKVGFPQYAMVLFLMGSYWLVADHDRLRHRLPLIASFCAYFAWIGYFDVLMVQERIAWMLEWVGAPTFVLGCLLVVSILFAGPRLRAEEPEVTPVRAAGTPGCVEE